ncbi:MAG: hypothetical protein ACR65X_13015 [Methylocystis sp.]
MNEFTFGGRRYSIRAPFDAGAALSAARRLRVLAEYFEEGAPFAGDPTTPDDGWLLSDVLSRVERSNDDGTREAMAWGELLHDDLDDMRDAVALFECAARQVACEQLQSMSRDYFGNA